MDIKQLFSVFCAVWYFPHKAMHSGTYIYKPLLGQHSMNSSKLFWRVVTTPPALHAWLHNNLGCCAVRSIWNNFSKNYRIVKNPITKISSIYIFTWIIDSTTTTKYLYENGIENIVPKSYILKVLWDIILNIFYNLTNQWII